MTQQISPLEQAVEPAWIKLARDVSDNPAQIVWPSNLMGVSQISALRKALADAANAMKGNKEKEDLVIATIMVGLAHIKKRRDKDVAGRINRHEQLGKLTEERISRDGWHPHTKEAANG